MMKLSLKLNNKLKDRQLKSYVHKSYVHKSYVDTHHKTYAEHYVDTHRFAMLVIGLCCVLAPATINAGEHKEDSRASVYNEFQQASDHFKQTTEQLLKGVERYCSTPDSDTSALVKERWNSAMLGWNRIQGFDSGPIEALEKSWSIQFWPDKKNTTGRKMKGLVKQQSEITVGDIVNSSVTVQGMGAIEWLFFDPESPLETDTQATCRLASVITENLHNNATYIVSAWQANPWDTLNDREWIREYVSLLSNQLEFSLKKLSRPLANVGHPRPYFSESWRSHRSLENLKQNVIAFKAIYFAKGDGMHMYLIQNGYPELAVRISKQLESLTVGWPDESSLFSALQTKQGYREMLSLYNKFEHLNYLISDQVAMSLGVVVGFNSTDGD